MRWLAQLQLSGYVVVESSKEVEEFASALGNVVDARDVEANYQEDARTGTFSASFGTLPFPWHSDGAHWPIPPRYVVLRAKVSPSGTTFVASADRISRLADPQARRIGHAVWRTHTSKGSFFLSLESFRKDVPLYRFDPIGTTPANDDAAVLSVAISSVPHSEACLAHCWTNTNQILIIDNWRMLHARSSASVGRIMRRCYVLEDS